MGLFYNCTTPAQVAQFQSMQRRAQGQQALPVRSNVFDQLAANSIGCSQGTGVPDSTHLPEPLPDTTKDPRDVPTPAGQQRHHPTAMRQQSLVFSQQNDGPRLRSSPAASEERPQQSHGTHQPETSESVPGSVTRDQAPSPVPGTFPETQVVMARDGLPAPENQSHPVEAALDEGRQQAGPLAPPEPETQPSRNFVVPEPPAPRSPSLLELPQPAPQAAPQAEMPAGFTLAMDICQRCHKQITSSSGEAIPGVDQCDCERCAICQDMILDEEITEKLACNHAASLL